MGKYLDLISEAPDRPRGPEPEPHGSADAARHMARNLVRTCCEYGIGLRLEEDGTLVVVSNGKAWRALVDAIEANVDEVANLVADGWADA